MSDAMPMAADRVRMSMNFSHLSRRNSSIFAETKANSACKRATYEAQAQNTYLRVLCPSLVVFQS